MEMFNIVLGIGMFTAVVVALVLVILAAKSQLVASGPVKIVINEQKTVEVPAGGKLLGALADAGVLSVVHAAAVEPAPSARSR